MKIYVIVSFRPHTGDYFFISNNLFDEDNKVELVSVPILGIIFLSLPSIVMITRAFKPRLSAESL